MNCVTCVKIVISNDIKVQVKLYSYSQSTNMNNAVYNLFTSWNLCKLNEIWSLISNQKYACWFVIIVVPLGLVYAVYKKIRRRVCFYIYYPD